MGSAPEQERRNEPLAAQADAVVVGAGIVGLTCALLLAELGREVVVVEASGIAAGVSGYTTAKLTAGHGLVYSHLESAFGPDAAGHYAAAQLAALDFVRDLVVGRSVDCDFEPQTNYVFGQSHAETEQLERETDAARRAGLPAEQVASLDVPFPAVAATMLPDQAQFHPRKYLLGLAALVEAAGGGIVTRNRVTEISGKDPFRLRTEHGEIRAPVVVVGSHYPIVEQGFFVPRIHPRRSYVVAAPLEQPVPEGMYINASEPTRSMRTAMLDDGRRLLLVGGEGHRVGQEPETSRRYEALERYMREHFTVGGTVYRWSTQDNHSVDRLPFVGPVEQVSGLFVATGFAGWGMTNGTMAALTIASAVQGEDTSWAPLFALDRAHLPRSAKRMVTESLNVARRQFGGPSRSKEDTTTTIEAGNGRIVSIDGRKVAVSRDDSGTVHAVSARCTHMGCVVTWNEAEASWDCPCHGSRFTATGEVLHGPALHPLEPAELSVDAERSL
jgi:glycine/D-amino acid oxidase-like deaminating enzyme/nitrite reductase/ring-hydroxylating ferredoxin subunit